MKTLLLAVPLLIALGCGSSNADDDDTNQARDAGDTARDAGESAGRDGGVAVPDAGVAPPVCGNGRLETGEACDDGNVVSGDGCDDMCQPEQGMLGCRNIAIRTGQDGDGDHDSVLLTTAFNIPDRDVSEFLNADGWRTAGPLTLCAGAVTNGTADVTLQADVTFAVSLPASNCLCRSYDVTGTAGTLYCEASADLLDFRQTADSMADAEGGPVTIVPGPGAVTAPGHMRITFMSRTLNIDANADNCQPAACATALAAETAEPVDYTTGTAVSEATNTRQGGDISISASGFPFSCDDWTGTTVRGALAGATGIDFDNTDLGNEKDVVTVERISE